MPLLPIDLQTLFSQLTHVGKEQAAQKDAAPHAQSLQGAQLVQKAEQRDSAVNETRPQEQGPERAKQRSRREGRRREKPPEERPPSRPRTPEIFNDPALGRNVDLTG
ncbi:MAG: hypothetical protein IMZ69_10580 [Spirochaetes bacterium]|nr:hypothetical protein [Spirochaetota bacterium]